MALPYCDIGLGIHMCQPSSSRSSGVRIGEQLCEFIICQIEVPMCSPVLCEHGVQQAWDIAPYLTISSNCVNASIGSMYSFRICL